LERDTGFLIVWIESSSPDVIRQENDLIANEWGSFRHHLPGAHMERRSHLKYVNQSALNFPVSFRRVGWDFWMYCELAAEAGIAHWLLSFNKSNMNLLLSAFWLDSTTQEWREKRYHKGTRAW
jgi:hypothetical protein